MKILALCLVVVGLCRGSDEVLKPQMAVHCDGHLTVWGVTVLPDGTPNFDRITSEEAGKSIVADLEGFQGMLASCSLKAPGHKGIYGWEVDAAGAHGVDKAGWTCMVVKDGENDEAQVFVDLFEGRQGETQALHEDVTGEDGVWAEGDSTKAVCYLRLTQE